MSAFQYRTRTARSRSTATSSASRSRPTPFGEGQRWIELKIPGAETGVVLFTPDGQKDRVGTFFNGSFACDDVRKSYEELKTRGVEFEGEPKEETWGTYMKFKDSEGNAFVLGSR